MSITLTTPRKVSLNDGVKVENNTQGAVMGWTVDTLGNTVTFFLRMGTVQGTPPNLNAGVYSADSSLVVDLTTGKWTATGTFADGSPMNLSGTVPAGALNQFVSQIKADRNQAEVFSAGSSGIMPGVQVPW